MKEREAGITTLYLVVLIVLGSLSLYGGLRAGPDMEQPSSASFEKELAPVLAGRLFLSRLMMWNVHTEYSFYDTKAVVEFITGHQCWKSEEGKTADRVARIWADTRWKFPGIPLGMLSAQEWKTGKCSVLLILVSADLSVLSIDQETGKQGSHSIRKWAANMLWI